MASKIGRPSKYSPQVAETIRALLSQGNTRKAAYTYAGISEATFARWCKSIDGFDELVQKAEAQAELMHVQNIKLAANNGNWTASAWWLERRRHQDWARRDRVEVLSGVRELAREYGVDEGEAVAEAETILRELRVRGK